MNNWTAIQSLRLIEAKNIYRPRSQQLEISSEGNMIALNNKWLASWSNEELEVSTSIEQLYSDQGNEQKLQLEFSVQATYSEYVELSKLIAKRLLCIELTNFDYSIINVHDVLLSLKFVSSTDLSKGGIIKATAIRAKSKIRVLPALIDKVTVRALASPFQRFKIDLNPFFELEQFKIGWAKTADLTQVRWVSFEPFNEFSIILKDGDEAIWVWAVHKDAATFNEVKKVSLVGISTPTVADSGDEYIIGDSNTFENNLTQIGD